MNDRTRVLAIRTSFGARSLCAAALVIGLSGCGPGGGQAAPASAPPPAPSPAPSAAASAAGSPSPAGTPSPALRMLDVSYAAGTVTGVDARTSAALGEALLLRVTSDVADTVHVHGYNLYAPVAPGTVAEIPITATIPGGFEVELEKLGKTLFQLRVS